MNRTNATRILDAIKACLVGVIAGVVGWSVYQPAAAQVLARGIGAHTSAVLAGPTANQGAPTVGQLVDFAWAATSLVPGVVFIAFFLTVSVLVYLILEWTGKSKILEVEE